MEEKTTLGITEVIAVKLADWMELNLQNQSLEAEKSNYQSKYWDMARKVEELKEKNAKLEEELAKLDARHPFREIDLINITRQSKEEEDE